MVTTIPYEPGWKVQIDGKTIENLVVEETTDSGAKVLRNKQGVEGQVVVLGTLIGIRLPAGHHTVSMKYTPPGFNMGVVTLILGIIALVLFYRYDKKHNKVLIARKKRNELFKNKTVDEIVAELNKEAETSKSKSKKKKKPKPEKAEGSSEDTEEKTEAAETEANAEEKPAEKSKKKAKASLVVAVPESDKEEAEEAVNDAERFIRNADASLKEGITEAADVIADRSAG